MVQLDPSVDVYALRPRFVEHGVWIRPFKDIVYLMPPLVINGTRSRTRWHGQFINAISTVR